MASFTGSVRLETEPDTAVRALVEVDDTDVVLYSGDAELGRWRTEDIVVHMEGKRYVLDADGERLILEMDEGAAFGVAVGAQPQTANDDTSDLDAAAAEAGDEFSQLRAKSAATYTEDEVLRRWVGLVLALGGVILVVAAVPSWRAARIFDDFPLDRILAGIGGGAAIIGAGLGIFGEQRRRGAELAVAGGVLGLVVTFLAGRAAAIPTWLLLGAVASAAIVALGAMARTHRAAAPSPRALGEDTD